MAYPDFANLTKQECEQDVPYNRYQPLCRRGLCVVSWLHLRLIAGTRWQRCMHFDVRPNQHVIRGSAKKPNPSLRILVA